MRVDVNSIVNVHHSLPARVAGRMAIHTIKVADFYSKRTAFGICPGGRPNGHPYYKSRRLL